jgi:hypothetical protein
VITDEVVGLAKARKEAKMEGFGSLDLFAPFGTFCSNPVARFF